MFGGGITVLTVKKLGADGWSDAGRQVEVALEMFRLLFISACANIVGEGGDGCGMRGASAS